MCESLSPRSQRLLRVQGLVWVTLIGLAALRAQTAENETGETDKKAFLEVIGRSQQANFEKIKTWKGTYGYQVRLLQTNTITDQVPTDPYWMTKKGEVEFVFDSDANRFYSFLNAEGPPRFFDVKTGKERVFPVGTYREKTVLRPAEWLHMEPDRGWPQFSDFPAIRSLPDDSRVLIRDAASEAQRRIPYGDVFDPRSLFSVSGPHPLYKSLLATAEALTAPGRESLKDRVRCTYEGNHRIVDIDSGTSGRSKYVYDPASGLHCTVFRSWDGSGVLIRELTYKYTERDGIVVPAMVQERLFNEGGKPKYERTFSLIETQINEPLNGSEFSFEAFGLRDGDRFLDKIENTLSVWKDGKWMSVDAYNASIANRSRRSIVLLLLLYLVIAVSGIVVWRYLWLRRATK